jgi:hypothetical protein
MLWYVAHNHSAFDTRADGGESAGEQCHLHETACSTVSGCVLWHALHCMYTNIQHLSCKQEESVTRPLHTRLGMHAKLLYVSAAKVFLSVDAE